jgi:hypothetical protein
MLAALCFPQLVALGATDAFHVAVSRVAPGFAIVTEISKVTPYVGQQFSIVYWLRAVRPPSAVDIDPQQFTGFWTETGDPPAESRPARETVDGKAATEYLLRQVIAFPLWEGNLELPALRLKIKLGETVSPRHADWDLVCLSDHVSIRALPVPGHAGAPEEFPLVGTLDGTMVSARADHQLILELQGTANLAFLDPLRWIRSQQGLRFSASLADSENMVQTRDQAGRRQLQLIQRRRWVVRALGFAASNSRVGDVLLRVFHPEAGTWGEKRLPGTALRGYPVPQISPHGSRLSAWHLPASAISAIAAAAGAIAVFLSFTRIRNKRKGRLTKLKRILAALEKNATASAKSFLDMAHKILVQYGGKEARPAGISSTEFDECWDRVERLRFSSESLSASSRQEIIRILKTHLHAVHSTQSGAVHRQPGMH